MKKIPRAWLTACLVCFLLAASAPAGPGSFAAPVPEPASAYFQFHYPPDPETFIFELSDPVKIQMARDMLAGSQPARAVLGVIVKEPRAYNPPWSFHLDPDSIIFFSSAIEVCDAGIAYVEAHLEEVCGEFLPGCEWCPWGARLTAEMRRVYLPVMLNFSP